MKFFNTVGVVNPKNHYFLPHRLNWQQLTDFIEKEYYFILHAPRQSGKTTAIIEFVKHLNENDKYTALYLSTEPAHYAVNDVKRAVRAILHQFRDQIADFLPSEIKTIDYLNSILQKEDVDEESAYSFLRFWAQESRKPLVLFFDEFDGLVGDSLIALLKQFRTGYTKRPEHFPQTICLVGVRDLRDYKVKTKQQDELGVLYSPFNIKAESLVLKNFSFEQVRDLYLQHTAESGQQFTDDAITYAYEQTQGQPWLVNALAYQACFRDVTDYNQAITKEVMERAKEALILRRDTHIDALVDRLHEDRVRKIIDAIVTGRDVPENFSIDDISYVIDLGLVTNRNQHLEIANPIYQEVIPRELTYGTQLSITQQVAWYKNSDGSLNIFKLLESFTQFYGENSEIWLEKFAYKESGPHLLLMAFLQRIINGGGNIHREYALGRKRVDLRISWPSQQPQQRIVIELKVWRDQKTLADGLRQTVEYMDKCNATEGHLVIFDRNPNKSWDEKIYQRQEVVDGKVIEVWGL